MKIPLLNWVNTATAKKGLDGRPYAHFVVMRDDAMTEDDGSAGIPALSKNLTQCYSYQQILYIFHLSYQLKMRHFLAHFLLDPFSAFRQTPSNRNDKSDMN